MATLSEAILSMLAQPQPYRSEIVSPFRAISYEQIASENLLFSPGDVLADNWRVEYK